MRIGLNTPDPQAAATEKTKKSAGSAPNPTSASRVEGNQDFAEDRVTLSALASQAMQTPDVRQAKIEALQQSISSGQYQLDSNESAEAMLSQ